MEKINFFSKNLKTWMFAHDKNQGELGLEIGMTGTAVGKWILENRPPKGLIYTGLCTHLKIDPGLMMEKDLTFQILEDAKYFDGIVAEGGPEGGEYSDNSQKKRLINHLVHVHEQLRILLDDGEKLLETVK